MTNEIGLLSFQLTCWNRQFVLAARHENGGGDLILFTHGLGCSKESFDGAFDFPRFSGFRLLAVDLVGYGDSSKPPDFSYAMEDQAQLLGLVLEKIEADRIHIVAHSMGCAIGLLLAERIPRKVASFVNVEGNLIAEDCGLISRKTIEIPFEEFRDSVFDKIRSKGPQPWRRLSAKTDPWAFYKSCESLVAWSDSGRLLDIFEHLEARKLYVYGDENSDMEILGRLGGIRKSAIPDSGHFVMNDNPREFYERVFAVVDS